MRLTCAWLSCVETGWKLESTKSASRARPYAWQSQKCVFGLALVGEDIDRNKNSSTEARALLALGSLDLGAKYFWTGIGAHEVDNALELTVGVKKAAHNTYLEYFAMGGIYGLLIMFLIWTYSFRYLEAKMLIIVCLTGLFLTLIFNSFLLMILGFGIARKQ